MSAYREGFGPVEQRRAEVALVRARVDGSAPALADLRAKRVGRITGSLVGLGILLLAGPLAWLVNEGKPLASQLLAACFFAAPTAAVAVALLVRSALRFAYRTPRPGTPAYARRAGEIAARLLRAADARALDALDPWPRLRVDLSALEGPSLVLPLVLAAMVLPLLAHALFYFPIALFSGAEDAVRGFSVWIAISAMVVGHAHVATAICAGVWGRKLTGMPLDELVKADVRKEWVRALWIAVAVASVPGIILVAVPTVLSLVTGLVVLPIMWHGAKRVATAERLAIEEVEDEVAAVRVGVDEMEGVRRELVAAVEGAPDEQDEEEEVREPGRRGAAR